MKAYITFTKKRLATALALLVCIGFICCELYAAANSVANAATNAERLVFIKQLGYKVTDETPTSKAIIIPQVFYDVYERYNALQKQSGYDLSLYKGCEAMLYTYKISAPDNQGEECVINIIVYNDRIIGGDVSSAALDGFMLPIAKNNEKTKT